MAGHTIKWTRRKRGKESSNVEQSVHSLKEEEKIIQITSFKIEIVPAVVKYMTLSRIFRLAEIH
jgi:uncharacterized HAD superfamily protein